MGNGNKGFGMIDAVYVFSFFLVLVGAFMMFMSSSTLVVVSSMAGMFLGFCAMILTLGLEFD